MVWAGANRLMHTLRYSPQRAVVLSRHRAKAAVKAITPASLSVYVIGWAFDPVEEPPTPPSVNPASVAYPALIPTKHSADRDIAYWYWPSQVATPPDDTTAYSQYPLSMDSDGTWPNVSDWFWAFANPVMVEGEHRMRETLLKRKMRGPMKGTLITFGLQPWSAIHLFPPDPFEAGSYSTCLGLTLPISAQYIEVPTGEWYEMHPGSNGGWDAWYSPLTNAMCFRRGKRPEDFFWYNSIGYDGTPIDTDDRTITQ